MWSTLGWWYWCSSIDKRWRLHLQIIDVLDVSGDDLTCKANLGMKLSSTCSTHSRITSTGGSGLASSIGGFLSASATPVFADVGNVFVGQHRRIFATPESENFSQIQQYPGVQTSTSNRFSQLSNPVLGEMVSCHVPCLVYIRPYTLKLSSYFTIYEG